MIATVETLESRTAVPPDELVRARFGGELTAATAGRLRDLFREAVERGDTKVILDLQAVTAMDACGVAALLYGQRALDAEGGRLMLRANRIVAWALKESGTIPAFEIWNGAGM